MNPGLVIPKRHGGCVVTIDARDRLRKMLLSFVKTELIRFGVTGVRIAISEFFPDVVGRSVAVQAGARLLHHFRSLRVNLVFEHIGMPALFSVVNCKRVTGPHPFKLWHMLQLARRDGCSRVILARYLWQRFGTAESGSLMVDRAKEEGIVLIRKILSPDLGVRRIVSEFDDTCERQFSFLLFFKDVCEQVKRKASRTRCEHSDSHHACNRQALFLLLIIHCCLSSLLVILMDAPHRYGTECMTSAIHQHPASGNLFRERCRRGTCDRIAPCNRDSNR